MRPRLLDLFCGAGGAAMGYYRAGFDVVGVDIANQRRFPFDFVQADAMEVLADGEFLAGFDVIHASPPCQAYSITRHTHSVEYPDLVGPVRDALVEWGGPWVIENVVGAPLRNPVVLCGASFLLTAVDLDGRPLVLRRHRLFESNVGLMALSCECAWYKSRGYKIGGVYGGGAVDRAHAENVRRGGYTPTMDVRRALMGIDWMTNRQLNESIPPAYTECLGGQLVDHLMRGALSG